MDKTAAILGVHLMHSDGTARVGTLSRSTTGETAFIVEEAYLRNPARPLLSLSWLEPNSEQGTQDRLANRGDKIGLMGALPPWFAGLLPEGALRDLVLREMGPGDHDQFDVLTRLGADLPGAVLITSETPAPASAGPLTIEQIAGFATARPQGTVKFSLAGVQLKFAGRMNEDRLTAPARAGEALCIVKVPTERFPGLPEAEFAGMTLARSIGVATAECRLMPVGQVKDVPAEFLTAGPQALVIDRFDRAPDGHRIHMEDMAQIIGASGECKYTMGTGETVLNIIRRFSSDWRADVLEGIRRFVADILIGNGDNHLKNWSFLFPAPGKIRLSPAYDIVPTILYFPDDHLALRFVNTHNFNSVTLRRFRRIAKFLGLREDWIEGEVRRQVASAIETWPTLVPTLLDEKRADLLLKRLATLTLVQEVVGAS
jgi:serine/threonine-protein kinase HipA